jgi:Flp pilus assembly protein TadG
VPKQACGKGFVAPRRSGSTLVEFAIVLPLLLAVLIGIMEFGWLVKNNLTIANAAREGARNASLGKTTTEIRTRVQNTATPLSTVSPNGSVTIMWSDNNGADGYPYPTVDGPSQNAVLPGKLIRVTVISKHQSLTGFFPFLRNRNLVGNATMRRE